MKILRSVFEEIKSSPVGSGRPEQGGVLFSSDGGETITKFIYDKSGSCSSVTYSPNVPFVNEQIKRYNDSGYYFIGCIHSHPRGCTSLSMGRSGGGSGYTASDEDAIIKLLTGMKGTKRLYFPVVQSAYHGEFSMRMFFGEKDRSGRITIFEDRCFQVVDDVYDTTLRREIQDHIPTGRYAHSTAIIVGAGNGLDMAEQLTRLGVSRFILLDGTRFEPSDLSGSATYDNIGGYKADAAARRIRSVNPTARVKIIRQYIDRDVSLEQFSGWLENTDKRRSIVVFCDNSIDDFAHTQKLCSLMRIALIRAYTRFGNEHTALVFTEFYDYWADMYARVKIETRYAAYYTGMPLPTNAVLAGEVNGFFGSPIGKKERRDLARSEKAQGPIVEKYEMLYTKAEIESKKVVIIGCGGSRSYAENLARSGIKHFLLIDADTYGRSNLQTQMAYADELNFPKAEVIAEKIKLINPSAEVDVVKSMLDETMTDEQFALHIGSEWIDKPNDVLIAACTDNVIAQARCSRLALKYGFPFLMAGIYPSGRVLEIVFFHPETTTVCPRCIFNKRIEANLSPDNRPKPAQSDGTSVFITEQLNAYKGFISLGLLLYRSPTADKRYSEFLDDNKWTTPKRKGVDRNFVFITMDSRMAEHSGKKAYARFDEWGKRLGSNYQVGASFFRKQKPLKHCPDCGGKGKPLIAVKGKMQDTRDGLYPKDVCKEAKK